jgi:pyruvate dehydrogenase E1 component alpha subunit
MADTRTASGDATGALDADALLGLLRRMVEIRLFEDEIQTLFTQNLVRGSTHLCNGQEAVAVGACAAMRPDDTMLCTYRGHGAVLAKGAPLDRAFAEILGKADGLCSGKGGSMHLTDVTVGAFGSFAIVGAHLPIALGLGFAARYLKTDEASLCFFGDGSVNIGAFHEALNLASVWRLPIVFVCENNLYGEYSPLASTTPVHQLADRAASYGMPGVRVDGNDVVAVYEEVSAAALRARSGGGPTLIEALTYRQKGHSRTDPGAYRPKEEVEEWLERDPIVLLERRLLAENVSQVRIDDVHAHANTAVRDALARAREWTPPNESAILDDVFA